MNQQRPDPARRVASAASAPISQPATTPNVASAQPYQFSLRMLLGVTTAVALGLAAAEWLGWRYLRLMIAILVVHLPTISLAAFAVYCRGPRQTFFLGALAGIILFWANGAPISIAGGFLALLGQLSAQLAGSFLCGFVAVATRRFIERRGWDRP